LRLETSNLTLPSNPSLPVVYGKLFLTALFWGGTFIAGRQVSQNLGPFSIAFLRFAMASVLLLSLTRIKEGRLPPIRGWQIPLVLLLGMTGIFAYNAMFFQGLRLIEASRAALIVATCPAFIAIASALFVARPSWPCPHGRDAHATEKLTSIQAIGIPLSILGAAVVISKGDLGQIIAGGVGRGELFILGCVLRAYPNNPAQRYVMRAQTRWSSPR